MLDKKKDRRNEIEKQINQGDANEMFNGESRIYIALLTQNKIDFRVLKKITATAGIQSMPKKWLIVVR